MDHTHDSKLVKNSSIEMDNIKQWSIESNKTIIIDTGSEKDLDEIWIKWNEMPLGDRRSSDWESLDVYGKTNKERYEEMKSKYLKQNINTRKQDYGINGISKPGVPGKTTDTGNPNNHGHDEIEKDVNLTLFSFHNDYNFSWQSGYKHCCDISGVDDYKIEHYENMHIINIPYATGHYMGDSDNDLDMWFHFTDKVEGRPGWFKMDNGVIVSEDDVPREYKDVIKKWRKGISDRMIKDKESILNKSISARGSVKEAEISPTVARVRKDRGVEDRQAELWSLTTMKGIIINPQSEDELKSQYGEWWRMRYNDRRQSDWKSIELYGKTNKERYDEMLPKYLKNNKMDDESVTDKAAIVTEGVTLHYATFAIKELLKNLDDWDGCLVELDIDNECICNSVKKIMKDSDDEEFKNEIKASNIHIQALSQDWSINEEVEDDKVDFDNIRYPKSATIAAEKWAIADMKAIIRPRDTLQQLEDDWLAFNSMSAKYKRQTDSKAIELFSIDNNTHYEFLKSKFLKQNIDTNLQSNEFNGNNGESLIESLCRETKTSSNNIDIIRNCLELVNMKNRNFVENILVQSTLDDSMELFNNNVCDIYSSLSNDLPFYSPDELIAFGVFAGEGNRYSAIPDNDTIGNDIRSKKWFDNYRMMYNGVTTENTSAYTAAWVQKLRELHHDYKAIKESGDTDKINSRMQSILELGWNPYIGFNQSSRGHAKIRISTMLKEEYSGTKVIDLTGFVESSREDIITEASNDDTLKPMFIVFIKSDTIFNKVVTAVTKGVYGHVAIGFDPNLKTLYSYSVKSRGFSRESLDRYTDVSKIKVFCIFTKKKAIDKVRSRVHYHMDTMDKRDYAFMNLITMPLSVDYKSNTDMVCSQFVDAMMKVADMDVTGKASSLVTPKDIYSKTVRNKSVYKVYEGALNKYNGKKVRSFIDSILTKLYSVKEFSDMSNENGVLSVMRENANDIAKLQFLHNNTNIQNEEYNMIYNKMIKPYASIEAMTETNEFPVQFDEDGNLLIKRMDTLDFEHEYSKSHKLMMIYHEKGNLEGMKYELCKLWFMNLILEKKLYDKNLIKDKQANNRARAKILNDFNKYLGVVVEQDNSFNFIEYYNTTPFNDTKIKINSSTLKYTTQYIKSILL